MNSKTKHIQLTKSQLSLWTSQKLHPDNPLHNVAHTFEISGTIDSKVFKSAFQELFDSTDILRTAFIEKDGIPFQRFQEPRKFELEFIDFRTVENSISLNDWILKRTQKTFDITNRVFDTVLLCTKDDQYIWFLNMHHLITDGVTTATIYAKMSANYSAILNNSLQTVTPQFTFEDYVSFENQEQDNPNYDVNRNFWKSKLNELEDPPKLYGLKSSFNLDTKADRFVLPLGKMEMNKLNEMSQHPDLKGWTKGSTIFNILSTVFLVLLYRVSNQKKIAIGTTTHNRTNKNFHRTPGFFIEVFPLLNEVFAEDQFLSIYQRVKTETNAFLKNIKPGLLNPNMGRSYNVLLNYIMTCFSDFNGYPTKSDWIFPGYISSSNLIEFHIADFDNSGDLELIFDINTSILNNEKRRNIPNQFLRLLNAFLADIHLPIHQPSLVSNKTFDSSISIGPKLSRDFESIINQFEFQVSKNPNNIAVCFENSTYTFEELNIEINQLARYLQEKNVGENTKVGVLLKRSPEYIISVMAILKTGAAFVPIPPNFPEERIQYIVEDSDASLLIGTKETLSVLNLSDTQVVSFDNTIELRKQLLSSNLGLKIDKRSTAFIIYTSGSTGKPKGVIISNESLFHYIKWTDDEYITFSSPSMPLFTSVGFDITANAVFLPLVCGGTIHVYQEHEGQTDLSILDVIKDNKVNYLKLTPAHLSLLKDNIYKDSKIKVMAVIGEEFKADLAKQIKAAFPENLRLINEYGPAEATIGCIYQEYTNEVESLGVPIGVSIPNMETYLLDDQTNVVPHGVIGELYLEGIGLADGYWGKQELTAQKFIENPFKPNSKLYQTRDLGRMDENGIIEFLGRTDFQVKIKGHRIELGEIESLMTDYNHIKESVVVVNEIKSLKVLVAFFTSHKDFELEDLQNYLAQKLPKYMVPSHYHKLENFPLSPNGKIDRLTLKTYKTTAIETKSSYVAPQTEIEELLAGIWEEVLENDEIGVTDNFIAIGGHSLAAIRITSRINKVIELEFRLNKIFELPTIKEYAKHIEETLTSLLEE